MEPTIVFYDGECLVCDLEMSLYKKQEKLGLLKFINIHSEEFKNYQNTISFDLANQKMHVLQQGQKKIGIDAFLVIWSVLPQKKYKYLSKIISHKAIRPIADIAYNIFAKYRKYLPKKYFLS